MRHKPLYSHPIPNPPKYRTIPSCPFFPHKQPMIPHLPSPPQDDEPLLRPLIMQQQQSDLDSSEEETKYHHHDDDTKRGTKAAAPTTSRIRRHPQAHHHYSSGGARLLIRLPNDKLIRVEEDENDDDDDDRGEKRLKSVVLKFGACGLRSCGQQSIFWSGLAFAFKIAFTYFYLNWSVIVLALAVCTLISIVYEAFETSEPLGQAAIVISLLPVINLLWIFFSWVYTVMLFGVWDDYFSLEASLHGLRRNLKSLFARNLLTVLVTFFVNGPVFFSLIIFAVQVSENVSDGVWRLQFFLSFFCLLALAILFFTGALMAQDHSILKQGRASSISSSRRAAAEAATTRTRWSWCTQPLRRLYYLLLHSEASQAVRIYMRSTIQGGGALSNGPSPWGKYAAESFLPQPVDLEGTTTTFEEDENEQQQQMQDEEGEVGRQVAKEEDDDDEQVRLSYQKRRHQLKGQGVKPWPTPWFAGWYIVHWWEQRKQQQQQQQSRRLDESFCFRLLVTLPWTLFLFITFGLLAYTSYFVKAYVLFAFIIGFFICMPVLHAVLVRLVVHSCSHAGLLALDLILTVIIVTGFLLSLSVASYYLGVAIILVIVVANFLVVLAHVPAIRDRRCPPPRTHDEGLAFHTKACTHTIITTARKWGFASILFLLILVISLRTVPQNYESANKSYMAARAANRLHLPPRHAHTHKHTHTDPFTISPPQPYAFCEQTFSRDRLTVLDLAHVSNAAYMQEQELRDYLAEHVSRLQYSNITLLEFDEYGPVTYMFDLERSKVLLFGIRGTNSVFDLFQDLDSYSEALLIQLSTSLFPLYSSPFFKDLLNKFVGTSYHLVEALSFLKQVLLNKAGKLSGGGMRKNEGRYYFDALTTYVNESILTNPRYEGYELLFSGHSLGGGVGQVVAARVKGIAVVFSAPGVVLSRKKFKLTLQEIDNRAFNICPVGDLVPLIDTQGVKAQQIRCSPDRLSYYCHSILHTIDEIEASCLPALDEEEGEGEEDEKKN